MPLDPAVAGNGQASKAQVFISYSRKDLAFADRLDAALKARGFEPLIDRTDIYAFEEWWKRVEELIARADTVIFVLSPDAVRPESVAMKEVAFAASLNKRFAPIIFRPVEDKDLPEALAKLNFIFFDDPARFDTSADKLVQALHTDIGWIRRHTEFGEQARRWALAKGPTGLLLRSPILEEAERWISSRPSGAPAPTQETQTFIRRSRQATTRRRNILTSTLAAGLVLALSLAGVAYWQRGIAIEQRSIAEQNAVAAERNAEEARTQKSIAERETLAATRQAARSDARADLIQAQLTVKDAPRDALSRAYQAAQKLGALGADHEALPLLTTILNSARELPAPQPYLSYPLNESRGFVRQAAPEGSAESLVADRPIIKPLMIVDSRDITGIIDDQARGVGRPIGSSDVEKSFTNDAAWLDDEHFILATGGWKFDHELDLGDQPDALQRMATRDARSVYSLFNAALRLYRANGNVAEEYLVGHSAPVTSVAVLKRYEKRIFDSEKPIILAGDAVGNLIAKRVGGELNIIPTGVVAPIKRIIVYDRGFSVILVFGRAARSQTAVTENHQFDIKEQKQRIASALGSTRLDSMMISYLGNNPTDDIGCTANSNNVLYVCDRKSVVVWKFGPSGLHDKPSYTFTAHDAVVTAIALSPTSPILATASENGQIRLWLTNGILLADISTNEGGFSPTALGFIDKGGRLLSGSTLGLRIWDVKDLAGEWKNRRTDKFLLDDYLEQKAWINFADPNNMIYTEAEAKHLKSLTADGGLYLSDYVVHGRFLIAAHSTGLRIINTQSLISRDLDLPGTRPRTDKNGRVLVEDRAVITSGASTTVCVLYGPKDEQSSDRRLYAIDEEAGTVSTEWPWPAELKNEYRISLTPHELAGVTDCWVASGQSIFIFSSKDRFSASFNLLDSGADSIGQIAPLKNSHSFMVTAAGNHGRSSILMLAHLGAAAGVPDAASTPVKKPRASVDSIAKMQGEVNRLAANSDGSRIAVSFRNRFDGVTEIKLFDRNLNMVASLPGSPKSFDELKFSPDGEVLRGLSDEITYERDLRLQSLLEHARGRVEAWAQEDAHAAHKTEALKEKDWAKRRVVLRDGVDRYPSDASMWLWLANMEFYTAKSIEDANSAMQLYDRVLSIDPFDPIAHYMRGKARALLGDNVNAMDDFSAAIELPHMGPVIEPDFIEGQSRSELSYEANLRSKAEFYLRRAAERATAEQWQSVIEDVRWLRENNRTPALGYELEALALKSLGRPLESIASYEQAATTLKDAKFYGLKEYSMKEVAWRRLKLAAYKKRIADINREIGRSEEATAAYATALQLIDKAFAASDLTVQTQMRLERLYQEILNPHYDCAVADYNAAIRREVNFTVPGNERGKCQAAERDLTAVITDYNERIKLEPQFAIPYYQRGTIYLAQRDYDGAIDDYSEAIKLEPQFTAAYNRRGNAYLAKKDYDRAIANYSEAISLDPEFPAPYNQRGNGYVAKQDYDRAIASYSEAIKLDPTHAIAYDNRGSAYFANRDYDRAIADYSEAIMHEPRFALAYNHRGNAYFAKEDYDHAIADYSQTIKLEPKFAMAYSQRGNSYFAKREYDRAIADYSEAIKIAPKFLITYNQRARTYLAKQDYDRAIADYGEAMKLEPHNAILYNNRGVAYRDKGEVDSALSDLDQAIKLNPRSARFYYNRGNARRAKAQYDRAIEDYGQIIQLDPNEAGAHSARCWQRMIIGEMEVALGDCSQSLRQHANDPYALESRGLIYLKTGNVWDAIADFDLALKLAPKLAISLYARGTAKLRMGDAAGSREDISAAKAIRQDIGEEFARYGGQ